MKQQLQIKMNDKLFLRDPSSSELGKKIVGNSVKLINRNGFENFTFKKLAADIGTTEAGIYRYFENKHKLLVYLISWYWGWLEFQIEFKTNNIKSPSVKLKKIIQLLSSEVQDDLHTEYIDESELYKIVITEGSKAYLTKHVGEDNKKQLSLKYISTLMSM